MTTDNNPPNIVKTISCSINSFKVENNSLKVISDCVDIETILDEDTGKSKKIVKFKQLSEISGEFEFNSIDSGIQMWDEDGIIHFDENLDSGRYIKKNYVISNNVIGKIEIEGRKVNLEGDGIQGGIKFGVIPNLIYRKLNFFVFKSKSKKLVIFEVITIGEHTKEDNYGKVGYCFLYNGNNLEYVTTDYDLSFDEYPDEESGHPLIKNTKLKVENKYNQKQYSLQLSDIKPNFKIDILDTLPTIIKKVVQALITSPYIFTYYERAKLEVKDNRRNGGESDFGVGFITSNFL
ncbi:hypothetical protein CONCODRAFT_12434 [Conidiobolus coronatus NRRL 28638]|uniref:Svf1-like C-terminal domain-containing protein n=1 Tax=Conidiobolus coronatus (strain ATCC 28846 / CBS 209.66 / NRRL 28638) TaxID=796925 RepID=A0A137NT50_CONC2|nr:hypothetical protein CONCODRAFT_12434 [Conidiobolus coronatus NRRL 28638]|eukprot:KXN65864.1 hypothetical protein CONCODRAFT_12434 [Conidiobolus coronatus NRRL 28638]